MNIFFIVVILFLPVIFQFIFGNKAKNGTISFRFWHVSLISLLGQVLSTVCNFFLIGDLITQSGSRDGLPVVGIFFIELIVGGFLILLILAQRYNLFRKHT